MAVITLSRQSGSEGNEITRLLCARLGYRFFDKQWMAELAAETGHSPANSTNLAAGQNQDKGWLERAFERFQKPFADPSDWAAGTIQDDREALNVQQICKMISAAYQHGSVVIVGRGGQVVLKGKPNVLHVRVVAPLETRIRRWQARENLSHEAARELVRERDEAHTAFVRRYFNTDINDPALYDLVISTEKITPAGAVDIIIKALETLPRGSDSTPTECEE